MFIIPIWDVLYDMDITGETIDVLLGALAEQLRSHGASLEIMVLADALRYLGADDADPGNGSVLNFVGGRPAWPVGRELPLG